MGGEVYVDPAHPNTGSEVVRWIAEHKPEIGRVVVHSCNTVAAEYMVEDLWKLGYTADRITIVDLLHSHVENDTVLGFILANPEVSL